MRLLRSSDLEPVLMGAISRVAVSRTLLPQTQGGAMMDLDPADPAVREAAVTLANNSVLPAWMQIPALGRDMTPIAEIAVAAAMPLIVRATADAIADPARWALEQMQREREALKGQGVQAGGDAMNDILVYGYDKCIELVESALAAHGRTPETAGGSIR